MSRLAKLIVLIALVAAAAYALVTWKSPLPDEARTASERSDQRPRLEEKYGFTSDSAGD